MIDERSYPLRSVDLGWVEADKMLFYLICHQPVNGCTLLIPKVILDDVGGFRLDLPTTQDYDLWLRIVERYEFHYFSGIALYSRQHEEQGSRTMAHAREVRDFFDVHLKRLSPDWMKAHFVTPEALYGAYLALLQRFAVGGFLKSYNLVLGQALLHSALGVSWKVKLLMKALYSMLKHAILSPVKAVLPLRVKNVLRRGLNRSGFLFGKGKPSNLDFKEIYRSNGFGSDESKSGTGSTLDQTARVREELPALLAKYKVKRFLDAPCGDFNWLQLLDFGDIEYIGGDIVDDVVAKNNTEFGEGGARRFEVLDIITGDLPAVDMIFCRDCLVHLNFENAQAAIENFKASGATYLLTTTFVERQDNEDLYGMWRPINLQKAPFDFPEPLELLIEECSEADGAFQDKALGLWKISDL